MCCENIDFKSRRKQSSKFYQYSMLNVKNCSMPMKNDNPLTNNITCKTDHFRNQFFELKKHVTVFDFVSTKIKLLSLTILENINKDYNKFNL